MGRAIEQVIGDGMGGAPAGLQRRMDAAGGERRDDARRIADQQHAIAEPLA